ncbi:hypothetical protein [Gimesia algae]|uniref:Uncharacterized protein n=1 Tax=Gimesia algae TaxID=2527971 RepID=A0A517VMP4_9PLAN|nr:hypothetical protein [Gimesia algae]QDT94289.1 hypothetical protein Pan161_59840 [Gimesia algae]
MGRYAEKTSVSYEKSMDDISRVLRRYDCDAVSRTESRDFWKVEFVIRNRMIRFQFNYPDPNANKYRFTDKGKERTEGQAYAAYEQDLRSSFRALYISILSKLENVESGLFEFEHEFMAHIVDPWSKQTMAEIMTPLIAERYDKTATEPTQLLLPGPKGK